MVLFALSYSTAFLEKCGLRQADCRRALCAFLGGSALSGVPLSRVTEENAEAWQPRELAWSRPPPRAPKQQWGTADAGTVAPYPSPTPGPTGSPLPELLEEDAVGEALATDADALQDAVTAQLVQHQLGLQLPRLRTAGQMCSVSGGRSGAARRKPGGRARRVENGWRFHPGQPNTLSTYYTPGTNTCPAGAHGPLGETDNN